MQEFSPIDTSETLNRASVEFEALLRTADEDNVKRWLTALPPADVASVVETLSIEGALETLRLLEPYEQGLLLGYISPERQIELATKLGRRELADIISKMSHDERVDLFKALTPEVQAEVLPGLTVVEREDLRKLAAYPEGTVGAVMTTDYASLQGNLSIPEAFEMLRQQALDAETIYKAMIVDANGKLLGMVSLSALLTAPVGARVEDVMKRSPVTIQVDEDAEQMVRRIRHYDVLVLPVVDAEGRLVGIVTQDDAMDVAAAVATEDFHHLGTVRGLKGNVGAARIFSLYRARVFWLLLLVFGNLFSGAGIAHFEDLIAAHVALVFFLPLLIDSGGNAGSQAATLMVRALATGDVRPKDWLMLLRRELGVAFLLGISMSLAVSFIGALRGGPEIALVVALSMTCIVLVGSLVGMSLPFILVRLKFDPATASAPLVTSISDATGVLVYFFIASHFLG